MCYNGPVGIENSYKMTDLVSLEYLPLLVKYNQAGHGKTGSRWVKKVMELMASDQKIKNVLDYGCGQGTLMAGIDNKMAGYELCEYDPAVPGKSSVPVGTYDLVVCTDVLEHVEPLLFENVLTHIASITGKTAFFVIATQPAVILLANGKNAHLIVKSAGWWLAQIEMAFPDKPITVGDNCRGQVTFLVGGAK
jgi:hypothetical protein